MAEAVYVLSRMGSEGGTRRPSVELEPADPSSPDLDEFEVGTEPWSELIADYFRGRKWLTMADSPDCYAFTLEGETIGYATGLVVPCSHPTESSPDEALYLKVFAFGVKTRFQGVRIGSGATIAAAAMERLEELAAQEPKCVGLYLWVNQLNERGIAFYRKVGFEVDPSEKGTFERWDKTLCVMRKALRSLP